MPSVHPGLNFGSFLGSFPFPIFLCVGSMLFLTSGKFASAIRVSRTFLVSFWIVCWAAVCVNAVWVWRLQNEWLRAEVQPTSYGSVSYFEKHGFSVAQSQHYHYSTLVGINGFRHLHYQSLYQTAWYGVLFLVLPLVLYWIDRRRARLTTPATVLV